MCRQTTWGGKMSGMMTSFGFHKKRCFVLMLKHKHNFMFKHKKTSFFWLTLWIFAGCRAASHHHTITIMLVLVSIQTLLPESFSSVSSCHAFSEHWQLQANVADQRLLIASSSGSNTQIWRDNFFQISPLGGIIVGLGRSRRGRGGIRIWAIPPSIHQFLHQLISNNA